MIAHQEPADAGLVASENASGPTVRLPHQLLDEGARRLAGLAVVLAVTLVTVQVYQRLVQPQIAPIIDDRVTRLVTLCAVLMGVGLFALHRYKVVTSRTLLAFGMLFEIVVAMSIAMVETSRPF